MTNYILTCEPDRIRNNTGLKRGLRTALAAGTYVYSGATVNFTLGGGGATQLVVSTQPAGAVSGIAFTTQPVVQGRTAGGQVFTGFTGNVVAAISSGSGSLSGTTTKAAVAGVATFTNLAITGTGPHSLGFTSAPLSSATSSSISVSASGGEPTPLIREDFSTYASTAAFIGSDHGIYRAGEDQNLGQMVIDTTTGYGSSSQSLRYDWPANFGIEQTICRNIEEQVETELEMWYRIVFKFSTTWNLSGSAYKFSLVAIDGMSGRFGAGFENGYDDTINIEGPDDNYNSFHIEGAHGGPSLFNNTWHEFKRHIVLHGNGTASHEAWLNGTHIGSAGPLSTATTALSYISLGKNRNLNNSVATSNWWGLFELFDTDPGW